MTNTNTVCTTPPCSPYPLEPDIHPEVWANLPLWLPFGLVNLRFTFCKLTSFRKALISLTNFFMMILHARLTFVVLCVHWKHFPKPPSPNACPAVAALICIMGERPERMPGVKVPGVRPVTPPGVSPAWFIYGVEFLRRMVIC